MNGGLAKYLIELGDDELVLAHRHSEWTGHAPILEEDIAFTNIALDEMGHAMLWYSLAAGLLGEDAERHPDELVYRRPADQFRNVRMVELPNGDWAFSMLRQYLFDAAEAVRLEALADSEHEPLAAAAAKIRTEELYHLRHTSAWITRLGGGTEESHNRLQAAVAVLLSQATQLFAPGPGEADLAAAGLVPDPETAAESWWARVTEHLISSGMSVPGEPPTIDGDRSLHTEHLGPLVDDVQQVARLEPEASW